MALLDLLKAISRALSGDNNIKKLFNSLGALIDLSF